MQNGECKMQNGITGLLQYLVITLRFCIRPSAFCILPALLAISACAPGAPPAQDPPPALSGVRAGDVVRVRVWREPDYSGEFNVDGRGIVILPVLGGVPVRGRQARRVSDTLRGAYEQYLKNPSIEITVLRRVAVSGAVAKP